MEEALIQMYEKMPETAQRELYDFAVFLTSRNDNKTSSLKKKSYFGALKDKITYIAPDFDDPLEDFAEYM